MERLSGDIWAFAQEVYARSGFADAALALQDRWGGDVCLLIAILWHAGQGACPDDAGLAALEAEAAPWRAAVVEPLRAARRAMKAEPAAQALRARVQALELEAERALLERLAAIAMHGGGPLPAGLLAYAARLGAPAGAMAAFMPGGREAQAEGKKGKGALPP